MAARLLTPALLLGLLSVASTRAEELAVVVNPGNAVDTLSTADLREILLMERQHWPAGGRIYLLVPGTGTPGKTALLQRVLRMGDDDLKRHYLAKLYAGEISSFPRVTSSSVAAQRTVARAANAIAVVEVAILDDSVKVLKIDGRGPGEADYILGPSRSVRREVE